MLAALLIALLALADGQPTTDNRQPTTDSQPTTDKETRQLRADVTFLADDAQEGRGLGTKGLANAAGYLEKRMRAIGLQPAFGKAYRQKFPVKTGVSLGANNSLAGVSKDDWTPLGFSSPGSFAGEIVFAGYGIDAPALNYRELEGLDLKGKVALILRYEPQEKDDKSIFDGRRPSRWSAMRYKVLQARERGAVAVIFVTGPLQDEGLNKVPALANDGPESPAGIPVIQVKTSVAQKWVDLAEFQKAVDADLKPRSRATGVRIEGRVDVKATFADADNIVGIIPGRGAHANEVVVLGAHYDHLGYGGTGSLKPNLHAIHNGADDNASGVATVLAIATRLQDQLGYMTDRRAVLVTLFAAEETGLGGSAYFVGHPPLPVATMAAMVNLDMVGMMRDDRLIVFGTESAPQWAEVIDRATEFAKIKVTSKGDGYGPSDQTSFYAQRVPVLHLFTGAHERYHTPDDKADTLNYAGMERVAAFGMNVMMRLAAENVTPVYARASAAPAQEGDSRGYGAYLGTVPDYGAMESATGGVKLADVRPGSPADKAGIRGGDLLVSIAGTKIENLYDMTYALQDHKPGETVDVIVVRGGERTTLRATLATRGGAGQAPAPAQPSTAPPSAPPAPTQTSPAPGQAGLPVFQQEKHLRDIRQLTFGGENAEAYWSPDGKKLIYQAHVAENACDQQYVLDLATGESKLVSSGKGRTTCGYFSYPKGERIIYASTEGGSPECPATPDRSKGYVWPIYPTYDLVLGGRTIKSPGYDAEATWCHQGGRIIFTSTRDGDLDLYEMNEQGKVTRRLTSTPGYDGGAFYSADCKEIVWRANHPTGAALEEYRAYLKQDLVKPTLMELFIANADGSNARQITSNGAANFCPYFTPDGKRIIFASNLGDEKRREFDLYIIPKSGGEPERVTFAPGFDGFPVFSPDGQWLVWASNRANPTGYVTNLFLARWAE